MLGSVTARGAATHRFLILSAEWTPSDSEITDLQC